MAAANKELQMRVRWFCLSTLLVALGSGACDSNTDTKDESVVVRTVAGPTSPLGLLRPSGIAVDAQSNDTYIGEFDNCRVWRLDSSGDLTLVAGTACEQGAFVAGPATGPGANLGFVRTVAYHDGRLFIGDRGNFVYLVNLSDRAISFPGAGGMAELASGDITILMGNGSNPSFECGGDDPYAAPRPMLGDEAAGVRPQGLVATSDGNLYIGGTDRVLFANLGAAPTAIPGQSGMLASGHLVSVLGTAQSSACSPRGDGGPAVDAAVDGLFAIATSPLDHRVLYVADNGNHAIRVANLGPQAKVVAGVQVGAGEIETLAEAGLVGPTGVGVGRDGHVYLTDGANQDNCEGADKSCTRLFVIDAVSGSLTMVAGTGAAGVGNGDGDGGPPLQASFNFAFSIAVDNNGALLVSDNQDSSPEQPASGRVRLVER